MRPDTCPLEVSLSELQKVGDELAANSGHRSCSRARIIYRRQVSLARDERLNFNPWQTKVLR
jgi:hypothetical protein